MKHKLVFFFNPPYDMLLTQMPDFEWLIEAHVTSIPNDYFVDIIIKDAPLNQLAAVKNMVDLHSLIEKVAINKHRALTMPNAKPLFDITINKLKNEI